tara:strand:- start:1027 stop:1845 length:819 start_codon:yes stop_codon:yes gene_type:complete
LTGDYNGEIGIHFQSLLLWGLNVEGHESLLVDIVLVSAWLSPLWLAIGFTIRSPLNFLQVVLWMPAAMFTAFLWRGRLYGRIAENNQGAVLISNHRSSVDPFFLQMASRRPIGCMIAREFASGLIVGPIMDILDVIKVGRRGVDTAATKRVIREAKAGRLICMFPEGRLNTTRQFMQACRPGAILVAIKAGVPIIPCYLHNLSFSNVIIQPFYTPAQVSLYIGDPIDVVAMSEGKTDKETLQRVSMHCIAEIGKLAGLSEWQPEMAGKNWLE